MRLDTLCRIRHRRYPRKHGRDARPPEPVDELLHGRLGYH